MSISEKLNSLKKRSGTHSPSISTIHREIPELEISIDACFLSNPYATDLFYNYFEKEVLSQEGKLRDLLEFYPGQNTDIAVLLSKWIACEAENIFVGNGAAEIIQACITHFCGGKVAISIPTFSAYYEFLEDHQEALFYNLSKENEYGFDVDDYISFILKNKPTSAVLINPNNPNGAYLNRDEIKKILEATKEILDCFILDESFIHFAYESDELDLISSEQMVERYPNLVVVKSMSKDFGVAGIRAGYAVMNAARVAQMNKRFLWNINGISEYFFTLYSNSDFQLKYEKIRKDYIEATKQFIKELSKVKGIKIYPSKANFILVEILNGMTSWEFTTHLLKDYGIYVRSCDDKIGLEGEYLRIASRKEEQNEVLVKAISEIIKNTK